MSVTARTGTGSRTTPFGLLGDERLARLVGAGHERAFAVVYERHHRALYRYIRSILRNDADAQDALQSTFTSAFAALSRGQRDAPIRPWLFRIAHNEAVSALRRRRPTADLSAATNYGTSSVADQFADRADLELVLRDLRELHERQRSALVMRELSGLSHEEIALALETSVGAAKQAIYEARRSLFEFAEGRAMPCDEIRQTISDADGRLLRSRRVRAHLRECGSCAAFAASIPTRRRELRALIPPLPAAAAAGVLERAAGAGAGHGAGGAAGLGVGHGAGSGAAGLASGAAGKAAGAALAANALAGVAVVATATVGVTIGVDKFAHAARQAGNGQHAVPAAHSAVIPARTSGHAVAPAARAINRRAASGPLRAGSSTTVGTSAASRANPRAANPAAPASGASTGTIAPAGNGAVSPGHSGAAPGHSTFTSTAHGHSGAAPGHSTSTARGHSGAAPGHSTSTAHGHSGTTPGHSSGASTAHGHSGTAPGHSSGASTSRGQSAAAPGHTNTQPSAVTVPSAPPLPSLPVDTLRGNSGAHESVPPGQLK